MGREKGREPLPGQQIKEGLPYSASSRSRQVGRGGGGSGGGGRSRQRQGREGKARQRQRQGKAAHPIMFVPGPKGVSREYSSLFFYIF